MGFLPPYSHFDIFIPGNNLPHQLCQWRKEVYCLIIIKLYTKKVWLPSDVQKDKWQERLYKENYNIIFKNDVEMRRCSYHWAVVASSIMTNYIIRASSGMGKQQWRTLQPNVSPNPPSSIQYGLSARAPSGSGTTSHLDPVIIHYIVNSVSIPQPRAFNIFLHTALSSSRTKDQTAAQPSSSQIDKTEEALGQSTHHPSAGDRI